MSWYFVNCILSSLNLYCCCTIPVHPFYHITPLIHLGSIYGDHGVLVIDEHKYVISVCVLQGVLQLNVTNQNSHAYQGE
jgi:hypothetical protein